MSKRQKYISWDELFIGIAELASQRSKDPSTQHGACIVRDNKVLSIGYNGLPYGLDDNGYVFRLSDGACPLPPNCGIIYDYWKKPDKYEWAVHAEENAILNAGKELKGSSLYLYSEKGYYPCSKCARMIVQTGIIEVVMKTAIQTSTAAYNWDYTKHMFSRAGVRIRILNV